MVNRILFLSLFLVLGCGKEVKFNSSNLESFSQVSQPTSTSLDKSGTLVKTSASVSTISYGGRSYSVSTYSSYIALEFVAAKAPGSYGVRFSGELRSSEIVLTNIQ
jgi:hypothetical protein